MWLLSCFFTSGWIHSCSREPSTHTRGLVEETVGGPKDQSGGPQCCPAAGATWAAPGAQGSLAHTPARAARGSGWGGNPPRAREGLSPRHGPLSVSIQGEQGGEAERLGQASGRPCHLHAPSRGRPAGRGHQLPCGSAGGSNTGQGLPPRSCPDPRPQLTPRWL